MTAPLLFIDPRLEIRALDLTVEAVSAHRWMVDTCLRSLAVKSHSGDRTVGYTVNQESNLVPDFPP